MNYVQPNLTQALEEPAATSILDSPHVKRLLHEGRELFVVAAYPTEASQQEVASVIHTLRPDTVCVGLDPTCADTMLEPAAWRSMDVFQAIKRKRLLLLGAHVALAFFQRHVSKHGGGLVSGEMLAAIHAAREIGAELQLSERDIDTTLRRAWSVLKTPDKITLAMALRGGGSGGQESDDPPAFRLDESHLTIGQALRAYVAHRPHLAATLVEEREQIMMARVREAPGQRVVAVIDAGHVEGMLTHVERPIDRAALLAVPPPSRFAAVLKWAFPIAIVLSLIYALQSSRPPEELQQMILAWILPNSLGGIVGVAIARGKLASMLMAGLAAPVKSPLVNAATAAGLTEAWLRKPTVADATMLASQGFMKNAFGRVTLVYIGAAVGTGIGMYLGAAWLAALL